MVSWGPKVLIKLVEAVPAEQSLFSES